MLHRPARTLQCVLLLTPMLIASEDLLSTAWADGSRFVDLESGVRAMIVDHRFWEPPQPRWTGIEARRLYFPEGFLPWKIGGHTLLQERFALQAPGDALSESAERSVEVECHGERKMILCEGSEFSRKVLQFGSPVESCDVQDRFAQFEGWRFLEVAIALVNVGEDHVRHVFPTTSGTRLDVNLTLLDGRRVFARDFLIPGVAGSSPADFRPLEKRKLTVVSEFALAEDDKFSFELGSQEQTCVLLTFDLPRDVHWARLCIGDEESLPLNLTQHKLPDEPLEYDPTVAPDEEAEVSPKPLDWKRRDQERAEGDEHWRSLEVDKAIVSYSRAIEADPRHGRAYFSRGLAYRICGDLDRAIADYNVAIKLETGGHVYAHRGVAYARKGELDKAIADYTEAIRFDPYPFSAYWNRALAYERKGDQARAKEDFVESRKALLALRASQLQLDREYDLADMVEQGFVQATGDGMKTMAEVYVSVKSMIPHTLNLVISPGTALVSRGAHQDMVTYGEVHLSLSGHEKFAGAIPAACLNAARAVPEKGDLFSKAMKAPPVVTGFLAGLKELEEDPPEDFLSKLHSTVRDRFLIALKAFEDDLAESEDDLSDSRAANLRAVLNSLERDPAKDLQILFGSVWGRRSGVPKNLLAALEGPPPNDLQAAVGMESDLSGYAVLLVKHLREVYFREVYLRDWQVVQAGVWALTDNYSATNVRARLGMPIKDTQIRAAKSILSELELPNQL